MESKSKFLCLVGPPKTASTTLYELLRYQSGFVTGQSKEPNIFSLGNEKDISNLKTQVSECGQIFMDATTHYFALPWVANSIYEEFDKRAHIAITLRDPVAQIESFYNHNLRGGTDRRETIEEIFPEGWRSMDLEEIVLAESGIAKQAISDGRLKSVSNAWAELGYPGRYFLIASYSHHVERYLSLFGERCTILTFEQITSQQNDAIRSVLNLVECPYASQAGRSEAVVTNEGYTYRSSLARFAHPVGQAVAHALPRRSRQKMKSVWRSLFMHKPQQRFSDRDRSILREKFRPDLDRVSSLTGLDLSRWKTGLQ